MFNVIFYIFDKKENSTKQPDSTTQQQSYSCILKEPSGILNPTISINMGLNLNPSAYNYCYIEAFHRYYYITEWTFENALWYASLSVDVLASYKTEIGDADFYILRSSYESDGRIIDTKYPTKANINTSYTSLGDVTVYASSTQSSTVYNDYFNKSSGGGYYYLAVRGSGANGYIWYQMTEPNFRSMVSRLSSYIPGDMQDLSNGLARKIADPLQYIIECYWLPFAVPGIEMSIPMTIAFGDYTINFIGGVAEVIPLVDTPRNRATITLPKHPKASTRGDYLNCAPFSTYDLLIEPFGVIHLDGSLMCDINSIVIDWYVDINTGLANLYIYNGTNLIASSNAQMGVPIEISQVDVSLIGMASNQLAKWGGAPSGFNWASNIAGAVAGAVGGFMGIDASPSNRISSTGSNGSFIAYNSRQPGLYCTFYDIVDEFNNEIGRPLCKVRKPKNIPGYIVVLDGTLSASGTRDELQQINNYLMGGFFYE